MRAAWIASIWAALAGCSSGEPDDKQTNDEPTTTCASVVSKLTGCGLISGTRLGDCVPGDPNLPCFVGCVLDADCAQMTAAYCDDAANAFADCLDACRQPAAPSDFVCADGSTISASWRCDGGADCLDGSDEDCPAGMFTCSSGLMVPAGWRCDGVVDCPAGDDERDCPGSRVISCGDGSSLPARLQCDGARDCSDGVDELDCAELTCLGEARP